MTSEKAKKTVLVTGGARGIGEAISRKLASDGWRVIIHCGKSVEEAQVLCEEIGDAEYISADLGDMASVDAIFKRYPQIDALVNNAGVALVGLFDTMDKQTLDRMYRINLFAPIELTRKYIPYMISKKGGSIVNISSVFGETGGSCEVDYSAAKAGIIGFTKALAREVGPAGVRVNCICPGIIDTDMNEDLTFEDIENLCAEIPLQRMGNAEEVADCVSFLLSEGSSYITGSVFDINGGWKG